MFNIRSFEAINKVFEFDHQQMNTFEFVRCSKNDVRVRSMFDKMVFDPSLLFLVVLLWFPTIEDCWWRHWRGKAAVIIVRNWKTFPDKIANWRTYFLRYYYQCWLPLQLSNKKRRFFGNVIKEIMSLMLPFVTTMALRSYTSTCQFAKMFNEQKKYSAEKMHFVGYWNWLLTTFVSYRCPQMDKKKVNSLQRSFDVEHLFRSTNSTSIYRQ